MPIKNPTAAPRVRRCIISLRSGHFFMATHGEGRQNWEESGREQSPTGIMWRRQEDCCVCHTHRLALILRAFSFVMMKGKTPRKYVQVWKQQRYKIHVRCIFPYPPYNHWWPVRKHFYLGTLLRYFYDNLYFCSTIFQRLILDFLFHYIYLTVKATRYSYCTRFCI